MTKFRVRLFIDILPENRPPLGKLSTTPELKPDIHIGHFAIIERAPTR